MLMALREQVLVLRDCGFERQTRLAVRQRREQEAEDAASGGQLHERSAVLALACNDHDQLGEMLSQLRHHRGDVGRARRVERPAPPASGPTACRRHDRGPERAQPACRAGRPS